MAVFLLSSRGRLLRAASKEANDENDAFDIVVALSGVKGNSTREVEAFSEGRRNLLSLMKTASCRGAGQECFAVPVWARGGGG